ncbi:MAG: outer membrane beta-barrel protein [Bacteroidales bacterium]
MKTKVLYIALALMLTSSLASAQGFSVLGGVNFQNINGNYSNGDKMDNDLIVGFHAGVNMQIPLVPEFYFQPGLMFSTKGAKATEGVITSKYSLSYLELPLNLVYKGALGNGHILLGFGPYIAYAISGKAKHEGGDLSFTSDIEFTNTVDAGDPLETTYFKALDAGGNIFAGYEMASGLFFQMNTQLGMLNINPEDNRFSTEGATAKNTGYGFSVGYRL